MGLLGSFFNFVDPILDEVDPAHNYVQSWTTGRSDTKGQSPYFETIAPAVVDYFLPGVGRAIAAADSGSKGDWGGAAINGLLAYGGMSGMGSTAGSGADGGLSATEATQGTQALSSTAGDAGGAAVSGATAAGGSTATNAYGSGEILDAGSTQLTGSTSQAGASQIANNAAPGQLGHGWQYFDDGTAISPNGAYYSQGQQVTGSGGQPLTAWDKARNAVSGMNISGKNVGATGVKLMEMQAKAEAQNKAKAEAQRMQMQNQANAAASQFESMRSGPAASFQTISPYAQYSQFQGGFNPRRRNGLLG